MAMAALVRLEFSSRYLPHRLGLCAEMLSQRFSPTSVTSRKRGATACIVGEAKTPDALRSASDQFFKRCREEHF